MKKIKFCEKCEEPKIIEEIKDIVENDDMEILKNIDDEEIFDDFDVVDDIIKVMDNYGILFGDIVNYDDGTVHIVGVDEIEWDEVKDAIKSELGFEVLIPDIDHNDLDDELIVLVKNDTVEESLEEDKKEVCPKCGKEICECDKKLEESNPEEGEPIEVTKVEDGDKTEIFTELPDFKVEVEQKGDKVEIEIEPKEDEEKVVSEEEPVEEVETIESLKEECVRKEFCIMKDGNNIECKDKEEDAVKFAEENNADKVLCVCYGKKDENGDEPELSAESIWEKEIKEEKCPDCGKELKPGEKPCKDCEEKQLKEGKKGFFYYSIKKEESLEEDNHKPEDVIYIFEDEGELADFITAAGCRLWVKMLDQYDDYTYDGNSFFGICVNGKCCIGLIDEDGKVITCLDCEGEPCDCVEIGQNLFNIGKEIENSSDNEIGNEFKLNVMGVDEMDEFGDTMMFDSEEEAREYAHDLGLDDTDFEIIR